MAGRRGKGEMKGSEWTHRPSSLTPAGRMGRNGIGSIGGASCHSGYLLLPSPTVGTSLVCFASFGHGRVRREIALAADPAHGHGGAV